MQQEIVSRGPDWDRDRAVSSHAHTLTNQCEVCQGGDNLVGLISVLLANIGKIDHVEWNTEQLRWISFEVAFTLYIY